MQIFIIYVNVYYLYKNKSIKNNASLDKQIHNIRVQKLILIQIVYLYNIHPHCGGHAY